MENHNHDHSHHDHEGHASSDSLYSELVCHFPYAVFSVALSLVILSFVAFMAISDVNRVQMVYKGAKMLFHSFHFMHIIFAATGVLITFFRFSKNILKGLIVGACSTMLFCTLSDSVLPYIGGRLLNIPMTFHLCFIYDLKNVLPFLIIGIINGVVMSRHHTSRQSFYSVSSHFIHIFISSLASSFYLVAHGLHDWHKHIGFIFVFLIFAVVVPCTLSDVVVPMTFARKNKKK